MRFPTDPVILGNKYGPRKVFDAGGHKTAAYHRGLDLVPSKAGQRVPIYAIADGTVRYTSGVYNATAGIHAIIEHPGPYRLTTGRLVDAVWAGYCHLSDRTVAPGQRVREGQQIGRMGTTGASTGVHLHLDIFDRHPLASGSFDSRIDPLTLIHDAATPPKVAVPISQEMLMAFIGQSVNGKHKHYFVTDAGLVAIDTAEQVTDLQNVIKKAITVHNRGHSTVLMSVRELRAWRDHTNAIADRPRHLPDIQPK